MLFLGRVRLWSDGKCDHDDAQGPHVLSGGHVHVGVDHHTDGHRLRLVIHHHHGKDKLTDVLVDPNEAEDK